MAYRNLLNVSCSSTAEVFRHVKDFITSRNGIADYTSTGLGWTLHDSYFATDADTVAVNDWVVVYSAGEDGDQDLYYSIKLIAIASGLITCRSGLYFNTSTNAWVLPYPTTESSTGPYSGSTFTLWVYGDLDHLVIIINNGTAHSGRHFGLLNTPYDSTTVLTTSAVSAGTGVVVPVASVPASWAVGDAVFIRDNAGIERAVISDITGTDVTMTIANSYASGAKVARDYATHFSFSNVFAGSGKTQIGRSGLTTDAGQTITGASVETTLSNAADPDLLNSDHVAVPIKMYLTNLGYHGDLKDVYLVSVTGTTSGNAYLDTDGVEYRCFLIGTGLHYLIKEV